ncbi:hypothetical protein Pdw03_2651 [Penicillium digitatum]|uniref:Uncharacterized protein n=3 Tax=Penicillium digitatum TaxID=36651 RepID=K9G839_PEND2|nr:hypothetical protein PDIP_88000 [Penicillium digitatum Pd1]EKV04292.1 hypothetical protein PDIP_88000 [Penicillium digitatum Pd1]EKV17162.1 hypothetical protein PDIG_16490 [Penicillium digitatum PHI26]QQK39797.1 hypothetical protein Pdw03_2651 [Penicillium digitatum]
MPPNSHYASSAIGGRSQNATGSSASMVSQGDNSSASGTSVTNLSSSFSKQCSISPLRAAIDPFGSLPWFGLEEVLLNLPDLPTLHQLCQASPAVADYLSHKSGVFPKVVERIMERREYEHSSDDEYRCTQQDATRGLAEDTRIFFRTLVYLWWKEDSVVTGGASDENPLPEDFNDKLVYTINMSIEGFYEPNKVGMVHLPRSTPPNILRHLLSLASRLRRDAHAFFHTTMTLCMYTRIQELKNKKAHWPKNGPRPCGIPINTKRGGYPLSWMEEQRLMLAFLKPYVFSVLQRVVCEKRLLKPISSLTDPLSDGLYPDTLKDLEQNSLAEFWSPFANYGWMRTEPMEQMETILAWMEEGKTSHAARCKRAASFTTCCPEFSMLTEKQLKEYSRSNLQHIKLPGPFWAQSCTVAPQSGVKGAGFRGEFQKFGVSFWDKERMEGLGLATPRMDRYLDQIDLAFRWSSLLLSNKKRAPKRGQQKKGLQFRSRTKAISLGE